MATSHAAPEALLPFLGPWVRQPEDAASAGVMREVQTFLHDARGVRIHARRQLVTGAFQQGAWSSPLDGSRGEHPAPGIDVAGSLLEGSLRSELMAGEACLQRTSWRIDPDTAELIALVSARTEGGAWHEQEARYTRAQVKQVLVYRRDLKMRKGKIAAQCAHASVAVFTRHDTGPADRLEVPLDGPMAWWVRRSMAKIVLSVDTEEDLLRVHAEARRRLLPTAIIRDAGKTEFKGVPTRTTVAVGPAVVEEIDPITGKEGVVQTKLA